MKVRVKTKYFLLYIFIFLFIYNPPLFSVGMYHILAFISYMLVLIKYRSEAIHLFKTARIIIFVVGVLLSLLFVSITLIFTTRDFNTIKGVLLLIIETIPCVLFIMILFNKYNYNLTSIFKIILNVSLAQSLISLGTFIIPALRNIILNKFYFEQYVVGPYANLTINRIYGLSEGLTYSMPVVQGFMACVAFVFALKISLRYLFYIPALLISAAINARTGLIVFAIGLSIIILINAKWKERYNYIKLIGSLFLLLQIIPIMLGFIELGSEVTSDWIKIAYNETISLLQGNKEGYYSDVNTMFFLPEMNEILYGSGKEFFGGRYNRASDIGYVNDLFLGGIIYSLILYASFILYSLSGRIKNSWEHETIIWIIIGILLAVNIKGSAFRANNFTNLFILLSVALNYNKYKKKRLFTPK